MLHEWDDVVRGLHSEVGLDDLRRHVLFVAIGTTLLIPWALVLLFSRPGATEQWLIYVVLALYGIGGVAVSMNRRSTALGGATLVAGLLSVATGLLWVEQLAWIIHLTPLLVVFAGAFTSLIGSLATAAIITIVLVETHQFGGPLTGDDLRTILVLTWANVVVTWLASEPTRMALRWSWHEFLRAEREADRARRRQGELAQLVKSLNIAQDRLEYVNAELARARRAADEARRRKEEFAATISHELRTPLNLIIGFSEMMTAGPDNYDGEPLPAAYQRDVDTIYRNARHLSSLIDDILDLAQIDAARLGLLHEQITMAELVREAVAAVEPLFKRKGLTLATNVPETLPPLMVDRTRVRQILINLLNNAARFTDVGGARVTAWLEDREMVIAVVDTGVGIGPQDLPIVFEEFRQVGDARGHRAGGSGLGLAISKRIAELHGGSMSAESQLGAGSTFYVRLPVSEHAMSIPLHRPWETWARPPVYGRDEDRVIVVYDHTAEPAYLLRRYLDGYQVVVANSVAEVRHLRDTSPVSAILVTGSSEPEMWRRAQQIRAWCGDLPVVTCSLPSRRDRARELGVSDYLVKPVLREQVSRLLRRNGRLVRDVLIVDDDPDLVDMLARMIRSITRRTQVRAAYGGADGLTALRARRPDLVILDLLMPNLDGYTLLQSMRAEEGLRDVPVVVVTARGNEEERLTAGMLGITRGRGLSIAEMMSVMTASLAELREPTTSNGPTRPTGLPA